MRVPRPLNLDPTPAFLGRFWSKVDVGGWQDCWPWTAARNGRYGWFGLTSASRKAGPRRSTRSVYAHRVAYELLVGPVPEGLVLDHVQAWGCSTTLCCNPLHLEPVTLEENNYRTGRTHCGAGHEFTAANTYQWGGRRHCRACRNAIKARSVRRLSAATVLLVALGLFGCTPVDGECGGETDCSEVRP